MIFIDKRVVTNSSLENKIAIQFNILIILNNCIINTLKCLLKNQKNPMTT